MAAWSAFHHDTPILQIRYTFLLEVATGELEIQAAPQRVSDRGIPAIPRQNICLVDNGHEALSDDILNEKRGAPIRLIHSSNLTSIPHEGSFERSGNLAAVQAAVEISMYAGTLLR